MSKPRKTPVPIPLRQQVTATLTDDVAELLRRFLAEFEFEPAVSHGVNEALRAFITQRLEESGK